jgi:hypothetical protein
MNSLSLDYKSGLEVKYFFQRLHRTIRQRAIGLDEQIRGGHRRAENKNNCPIQSREARPALRAIRRGDAACILRGVAV